MTGSRMDIGPNELTIYDANGEAQWHVEMPPSPGVGSAFACDCCERLPAGTTARVLTLLDPDHPAARTLRAAVDPEDASDAP